MTTKSKGNSLPSDWTEVQRNSSGGYTVTTGDGSQIKYKSSPFSSGADWTEIKPSKSTPQYRKGGLVRAKPKATKKKGCK